MSVARPAFGDCELVHPAHYDFVAGDHGPDGSGIRASPSALVSAVIPAKPPSCIVSIAVIGTMTMVALLAFNPSVTEHVHRSQMKDDGIVGVRFRCFAEFFRKLALRIAYEDAPLALAMISCNTLWIVSRPSNMSQSMVSPMTSRSDSGRSSTQRRRHSTVPTPPDHDDETDDRNDSGLGSVAIHDSLLCF